MSIENDLKTQQTEALSNLLKPFADNEINKLPKPYPKDSPKSNCKECGGYHGLPAAHLDYVGHAALTKRLLETDLNWTWEPVAFGDDGLPKLDSQGGLWIRLTICGVTRLGYGDSQGKSGPNAIKEAIGDALRNAGMRFGAALDLWHKGDLWDVKEAKGVDDDGVIIGAGSSKVTKNAEKPAQTKTEYPEDVLFAASSAIDFIETAETETELKVWYGTPAIQKLLDVPVDLAGTTIKSATKARVAQFQKGASNV